MSDNLSSTLTAIASTYGLPLLLVFWYACRVRAFPMALGAVNTTRSDRRRVWAG